MSHPLLQQDSLLFLLLAGRILLSWFPAGSIGGHGPAKIGITLVASGVVGCFASIVMEDLPVELAWGFLAVALAARLISLPAPMVPRHEPPVARASVVARLLLVLIVLPFGWLAFKGTDVAEWQGTSSPTTDRLTVLAMLAGACACIAYGGRVARRSPAFTRALILLFLASPVALSAVQTSSNSCGQAFLLAAGSAFTLAWLRRADKRARLLAVVAYACLAMLDGYGVGLALAGFAGLVAFTPKPSLITTAKLWGIALVLAALFNPSSVLQVPTKPSNAVLEILLSLSSPDSYALLVTLTLVGFLLYALKKSPGSPGIDPPRREGGAAFFVLASALLVSQWKPEALLPLAVLLSFAALLSLVPAEKSSTTA